MAIVSRVSAMGEIASAFAHEVNQPLTALIAYSQSCLVIINNTSDYEKIGSKLLKPLKQIALRANLAVSIINNMKEFMKGHDFSLEDIDINTAILDTFAILKYELLDCKLKVILKLADDLPMIKANKIYIMQVILNLVRNSMEALQEVSHIYPELIVETSASNHNIAVHVIDNGPGILPELRSKILNSYFTTKPQGTGIGLGICRSLIEAHGGALSVRDQDSGAWFTFTLPIK
jgi:two-component system sensor kinase FixL